MFHKVSVFLFIYEKHFPGSFCFSTTTYQTYRISKLNMFLQIKMSPLKILYFSHFKVIHLDLLQTKDQAEGNHKHTSTFLLVGFKWILSSSPAHVSSSLFKCLSWNVGHGSCQPSRGRAMMTFVLGEGYDDVSSKYSPVYCQHELLFLLLLWSWCRGRVDGRRLTQIGLVACQVGVWKSKKDRSQCFWLCVCVCVCVCVWGGGPRPLCVSVIGKADTSCSSGFRCRERFHSCLSTVILELSIRDGK